MRDGWEIESPELQVTAPAAPPAPTSCLPRQQARAAAPHAHTSSAPMPRGRPARARAPAVKSDMYSWDSIATAAREAGDGLGSSMGPFPYHLAPILPPISRPSPAHLPLPPAISRPLEHAVSRNLPLPPCTHTASPCQHTAAAHGSSSKAPAPALHRAWRASGPDPHPENMRGLARRAPDDVNRRGGPGLFTGPGLCIGLGRRAVPPSHRLPPPTHHGAISYQTGGQPTAHHRAASAPAPAPHPRLSAHRFLPACLLTLSSALLQVRLPQRRSSLSLAASPRRKQKPSSAPVRHALITPALSVRAWRPVIERPPGHTATLCLPNPSPHRRAIQPRYAPLVRRIFATPERR